MTNPPRPPVRPLTEGYVVKGGHNSGHVSDTDPSCGSCAYPGIEATGEQSPVRRPQQWLSWF